MQSIEEEKEKEKEEKGKGGGRLGSRFGSTDQLLSFNMQTKSCEKLNMAELKEQHKKLQERIEEAK